QQQVGLVGQGPSQRYTFARAARQSCDERVSRQAQLFDQGVDTRGPLPVFAFCNVAAKRIENSEGLVELGLLLYGGDLQSAQAHDFAVVGAGSAIQQFKQGGLSGAVPTNKTNTFARLYCEVGVIQQRVVTVRELDVG